jgi:hypothetical protein
MAISVAVHPQLMLQLSDQYVRRPFLADPHPVYSVGIILGSAEGPRIEASSALEVRIFENRTPGSGLSLDMENYRGLLRLHQQIYKEEKPIGWYSCQELPPAVQRGLHTILETIEHSGPFLRGEFLEREQPFRLFLQRGEGWTQVEYIYEVANAERIAMMQIQSEGSAQSQVAFTADAYRSLDQDLEVIEGYLVRVANGDLPFDSVLVRKCAEVGQWWDHKTEKPEEDTVVEQENLALLVGMMAERLAEFAGNLKRQRYG